ncbi:MAG TPA: hypothetical protein DER20_09305 [Lachnospiraceae bacterium]|nr:hypothetical protein [Lachnospiraceae bacterium]
MKQHKIFPLKLLFAILGYRSSTPFAKLHLQCFPQLPMCLYFMLYCFVNTRIKNRKSKRGYVWIS